MQYVSLTFPNFDVVSTGGWGRREIRDQVPKLLRIKMKPVGFPYFLERNIRNIDLLKVR